MSRPTLGDQRLDPAALRVVIQEAVDLSLLHRGHDQRYEQEVKERMRQELKVEHLRQQLQHAQHNYFGEQGSSRMAVGSSTQGGFTEGGTNTYAAPDYNAYVAPVAHGANANVPMPGGAQSM